MSSEPEATIIPVSLTVDGKSGVTLWAPPWEDAAGEQWQGFLGDGAKILLYPNAQELWEFIDSGAENDLSDHPLWGRVELLSVAALRPGPEDCYNLDQVYELAADEPDPVHVSALADVVDMVARIAECCDDGALRRLITDTPAYADLVDEDNSYQGKDGRIRWSELGDTIADSWERALVRVKSWLRWEGDFTVAEPTAESIWERVGAEPIKLIFTDVTYLTVWAQVPVDTEEEEPRTVFLGAEGVISVFESVPDLARFCREATEHELVKLEWWNELAEVADDAAFTPEANATFDLRSPSPLAAVVLRELAQFLDMSADTDVLENKPIDKDDWRALAGEVLSALRDED